MKWGAIFGISLIIICIVVFQWPKMNQCQKKEKAALISLSVIGWILAILLLLFPNMSGPTQLIDAIFNPLGKLLEK